MDFYGDSVFSDLGIFEGSEFLPLKFWLKVLGISEPEVKPEVPEVEPDPRFWDHDHAADRFPLKLNFWRLWNRKYLLKPEVPSQTGSTLLKPKVSFKFRNVILKNSKQEILFSYLWIFIPEIENFWYLAFLIKRLRVFSTYQIFIRILPHFLKIAVS